MGQFSLRLCLAQVERGVLCERTFFPNHIITYPFTHNEVVKSEKDAIKHDVSCNKITIFSTNHIYVLNISSNKIIGKC